MYAMNPSAGTRSALFAILVALVVRLGAVSAFPFGSGSPVPGNGSGQKFLSFTFFLHDNLLSPTNPSAFVISPPLQVPTITGNNSYFGTVVVFDDSMTVAPIPTSLEIGRGRGIYVFDANDAKGAAIEFLWTAEFNAASGFDGSTLTFKGFDRTLNAVREIAIVGGTGQFRLARGWAVITTYSFVGVGAANLNITASFFYGY